MGNINRRLAYGSYRRRGLVWNTIAQRNRRRWL